MTLTNDSLAIISSSSSDKVSPLQTDNMINMTPGGMYVSYNVDSKGAFLDNVNEESCKKACLRNCSCKAAFFQYGRDGNTSQGSCYLPTQVFSLQENQMEVTNYSSSAYLKIDYNKRPQMSVVVKVLEGTVNVETNIEFNFVAMGPGILSNDEKLAASAPLLASHLSGPR
ncbi:hypothetical protein HU200_027813 [Digitaria exilis]|uniref:Apple domain-containing protein n=1 Tax=Digitaria exilis TaxID=1010633 RepID=A0A835BWU2_9POAL|nr:hypothetical protein HU200_027813 [Digitaria exilis]